MNELAKDMEKVETPVPGGDFKSFLREKRTFDEFKEELNRDFKEMTGIKNSYPDNPKK